VWLEELADLHTQPTIHNTNMTAVQNFWGGGDRSTKQQGPNISYGN